MEGVDPAGGRVLDSEIDPAYIIPGGAAFKLFGLGVRGVRSAGSQSVFTYSKGVFNKHYYDVVRHGANRGELTRPFMRSNLAIQEIIKTGRGVPDATARGALRYNVPGSFRGSQGTWELVVDQSRNIIYHFNFRGK